MKTLKRFSVLFIVIGFLVLALLLIFFSFFRWVFTGKDMFDYFNYYGYKAFDWLESYANGKIETGQLEVEVSVDTSKLRDCLLAVEKAAKELAIELKPIK